MNEHNLPICTHCYAVRVEPHRARAPRPTCMDCGEKIARAELKRKGTMCQPINKSTPTYISDPAMLMQLNPKRTVG